MFKTKSKSVPTRRACNQSSCSLLMNKIFWLITNHRPYCINLNVTLDGISKLHSCIMSVHIVKSKKSLLKLFLCLSIISNFVCSVASFLYTWYWSTYQPCYLGPNDKLLLFQSDSLIFKLWWLFMSLSNQQNIRSSSVQLTLSLASSSYVHLHSLDRALRTVRTVVRMMVDVGWHAAHASRRWPSGAAHPWRRLLAIIERLDHAACVGTCLGQQEVVLEYTVVIVVLTTADASIQHLWSVILQILHESRLSVIHQIVLVWRSSSILRIVESGGRCIWIRAKIVYVEVLVDAHETAVPVAGVVKWSVGVTANGATAIRELASRIWFVRLVQRVSVVISCLLPSTTDCCVVAAVIMDYVAATGTDGSKVTNIEWSAVMLHVGSAAHVTVDWLLARVVSTSMMEPSLVELVGSNLTKGILVFSRTGAEVATVALVDRVACSTRSPLLSQLGFGNRLWYRIVSLVSSTVSCTREHNIIATGIEKLRSHHHLLLLASVRIRGLPLVHQVEEVSLIGGSILVTNSTGRSNSVMTHARCGCSKGAGPTRISVVLGHHGHVVLVCLRRSKVIDRSSVASVALSQLSHEVTVEHGLPHLNLLIARHLVRSTMITARTESTNSRLVKYLIFVALTIDIW